MSNEFVKVIPLGGLGEIGKNITAVSYTHLAGPAGLMAAKSAAELGLKVTLIEKNKNFDDIRRACSSQFILDDGYENELLKISNGKILFTKNNFEVKYSGSLVEIKNKYYYSPKGHRIHFAHPNEKAFALKFDKKKLLQDLYYDCANLGVNIKLNTLALNGKDLGSYVKVNLKTENNNYPIYAKKLIIAEGANANLTGKFGFNRKRTKFATAHVLKFIFENISDVYKRQLQYY